MPIRVTCPGCHTRFNVSDKFAGREGPCPKCKANIRIPDKSQEVIIHAPQDTFAKDQKGVSLSKPIFRQEMIITPVGWTAIMGVIALLLGAALILRWQILEKSQFPTWLLALGSLVVAMPAVYGAYGMLRDSELGGFIGRELWLRVGICAALYALLWLAMPLAEYAFSGYYNLTWFAAMAAMIGIGGAVAMSVLDFEYLVGVLHYGMYLGCTLLFRWIMGIGIFPGRLSQPPAEGESTVWLTLMEFAQRHI